MDGTLVHAKKLCRFCRTTDEKKNYVSGDTTNFFAPMICEDCIDEAAEALARLRRAQK